MKSDLIDAFYVSVKYALSTKAEVNDTPFLCGYYLFPICSTKPALLHPALS